MLEQVAEFAFEAAEHRQAGSCIFPRFVRAGDETVRSVWHERDACGEKEFVIAFFCRKPWKTTRALLAVLC